MEWIKNLHDFMHEPLMFTQSKRLKHGDFFTVYLGPKKFHFVAHPDLAEQILISNAANYKKSRIIFNKIIPITGARGLVQLEGSQWQTWRKRTGELFSREAFRSYPDVINSYLEQSSKELDAVANEYKKIDIAQLFVSYAIKSATRIFIGSAQDNMAEKIARDFIALNQLCGIKMRTLFSLPLIVPTSINRQILGLQKSIKNNLKYVLQNNNMVHEQSLLGILTKHLPAHDQQALNFIFDQLMTFLFAGFETTAASLTFCFYLLAEHEDVQDKIRAELSSYDNHAVNIDTIKNFPYANAAYREALRLYPPAWILAREASRDDELFELHIKKGDNVIICVREIHRHQEFWCDGDSYRPARFFCSNDRDRLWRTKKCSFIPFGAGARICSGTQLAMLEAISSIAFLLKRYAFSAEPSYQLDLEAMVTLCPRGPVFVKVKKL